MPFFAGRIVIDSIISAAARERGDKRYERERDDKRGEGEADVGRAPRESSTLLIGGTGTRGLRCHNTEGQ